MWSLDVIYYGNGHYGFGQAECRDCPGRKYGDSTLQRVSCSDTGGVQMLGNRDIELIVEVHYSNLQ